MLPSIRKTGRYKNTSQALKNQVKKAYKSHLKNIELGEDSIPHLIPYRDGLAVFVLEPGLYQLIFSKRFVIGYLSKCFPLSVQQVVAN